MSPALLATLDQVVMIWRRVLPIQDYEITDSHHRWAPETSENRYVGHCQLVQHGRCPSPSSISAKIFAIPPVLQLPFSCFPKPAPAVSAGKHPLCQRQGARRHLLLRVRIARMLQMVQAFQAWRMSAWPGLPSHTPNRKDFNDTTGLFRVAMYRNFILHFNKLLPLSHDKRSQI